MEPILGKPVAVIGLACNLPGDNHSPEAFWNFILNKGDGISEIPDDRWTIDQFYDENPDAVAKMITRRAGFVTGLKEFDAQFFGISPREAASMDPQQRMLLQGAYQAILDSRIPADVYSKEKTGVYVGIQGSDYRSLQEMRFSNPESFAGTGNALCIAANRVSHRLNLDGPSMAIDTACSSSMMALDNAVRDIQSGKTDFGIAMGVNALIHPTLFIAFSRAGMLSPTGTISTFDKAANGFVRAEGFGAVVLKSLDRAESDGDRIYAVINATHSNQDGYTSTITAPNQVSQAKMLEELIGKSGVPKDHIGYVEAHGTGTPVGDPIEAGAIGRVVGQNARHDPVHVGSVKANIGHLESGAGIVGVLKAVLTVYNGKIAPNVNFSNPNPNIPFDALNLKVPTEVTGFPESPSGRHVTVNSFGFGGANASALISSYGEAPRRELHAVVMPEDENRSEVEFPYFFPLSGASDEGIRAYAARLKTDIETGKLSSAKLADIAYSLGETREHRGTRTVILARTRHELLDSLSKYAVGEDAELLNIVTGQSSDTPKICFMFAGQGSQNWNMGREFLQNEPVYADAIDAYDRLFTKGAGWSIKAELLRSEEETRIHDTTVTQPALFAIQSGLAALWKHFGVEPDMVVGHSIGEAAASYVAGGMSLETAARFLNKRGSIRDQIGMQGGMAAIGLTRDEVEELLPEHGKIGIAAVNGPGSVTISGDLDAIEDFVEEFEFRNPDTFIRQLQVDTAWHSYQLDRGEAWFREEMAQMEWTVPHLPFISTVTGQIETRFDTDYGWLNLRKPVLFQAGVETALELGASVFVELGPHSTLKGPANSTALEKGERPTILNSLSRKENDFDVFARNAAELFVSGQVLNWSNLNGPSAKKVDLPDYAWSETEYWKSSEEADLVLKDGMVHPFLGMQLMSYPYAWQAEINLAAHPFIKDHRLASETLFPAAGYVDIVCAMARQIFGDKPFEAYDLKIHEAFFIQPDDEILLSTRYYPDRGLVQIFSGLRGDDRSGDFGTLRSEAFIRLTDVEKPKDMIFDKGKTRLKPVALSDIYDVDRQDEFINYGDTFRTIREAWSSNSEAAAKVTLDDDMRKGFDQFLVHPTLLDGCLQLADPRLSQKAIAKGRQPGDPAYLPVGADRVRLYRNLPEEIFVHFKAYKDPDGKDILGKLTLTDMSGEVVMVLDGLRNRTLPTKAVLADDDDTPPHFVGEKFASIGTDIEVDRSQVEGTWVLLANDGEQSKPLQAKLRKHGCKVKRIDEASLKGDSLSSYLDEKFGEILEAGELRGIIYAWSLSDEALTPTASVEAMYQQIERHTMHLISLGDFLDQFRSVEVALPRVTVLSANGYGDLDTDGFDAASLTQAPIMALTRGLASESQEYQVRHVSSDMQNIEMPDLLAAWTVGETAETELALSGTRVFVPRLARLEEDAIEPELMSVPASDHSINFHATMKTPGVIDDLRLEEIPMEAVGAGQVRLRIAAVGLNFRDIMAVTGLLPSEAEPDPAWQHLGLEFGAEVVEVGKGVKDLKVGDRVMGMNRRCLQRFMTVGADTVAKLPNHISLEDAATIPSAFATAHFALNRTARMRKGEKVFIHVATGGVGTAAVQLAQAVGAEIFATAGNPKKRKVLEDLGVPHVMNSRTLEWADDVERITKGKGVDVLLNSLPGDYIKRGLEVIAPYGRFVEIGKRDVYEDASIGMKALRRNVSLSVLDLAAMGQERPELMAELLEELVAMFKKRELSPLPVTSFPISEITDAFRYMSQAKHIGKVVVTLDDKDFQVRRDLNRDLRLDPEASYLVTGGTGGFGLTTADWMSSRGAGQVVLASRSGEVKGRERSKVARMEKRGTVVKCVALDATNKSAVHAFFKDAKKWDKPIKGIIHGAAVIEDGFMNQLTPDMITRVLRPKVLGGWNIHRALEKAKQEVDFFVNYSSIAQMIGSPGQANYIAANAFLDALAKYRVSKNQAGSSMSWGAILQSGFVARNEQLASYLETVGLGGLTDKDTYKGMELALTRELATGIYSKADWEKIARANAALGASPRFTPVMQKSGSGNAEVRARLVALEPAERIEEIQNLIIDEICNVLKVEDRNLDPERNMNEFGLDSLSAFELKMRLETMIDMSMPISRFLNAPSISTLSKVVSDELDASVRAEAEKAAQEGASDDAGSAGTATRKTKAQWSDRQIGLFATETSKATTTVAREILYVDLVFSVAAEVTDATVNKALQTLAKSHPYLAAQRPKDLDQPTIDFAPKTLRLNAGDTGVELCSVSRFKGKVTLHLHRAICDQASEVILKKDFNAPLKGKPLDKGLKPAAILKSGTDLRYDPESDAGQNDRAYWWYAQAEEFSPVTTPTRGRAHISVLSGVNRGPVKSRTIQIGQSLSERDLLQHFARSIAATFETGPDVLIARYLDLRKHLGQKGASGHFETAQPISVPVRNVSDDRQVQFDRVMANADSHIRFDLYAAAEQFGQGIPGFSEALGQVGFAYGAAGSLELHEIGLRAIPKADAVELVLTVDADVVDDFRIEALVDALRAELQSVETAAE